MSILDVHIESRDFHHGYLLVGDFEISRKMALEAAHAILASTYDVDANDIVSRLQTNPDFFYQKFDLFGIEESRALKEKASKRPFVGEKKIFIIELLSFSLESANALLKTMEEPYPGTHFFIIVPSLENIIPTLVSRLTIIDNTQVGKELDGEKIKFYKKFLADLPSKRLETVKKFLERQEAIEFLNDLELVIRSLASTWKQGFQVLEQIQNCRSFLFSQGSSAKMVLEHIALALPQM